MNDKTLSQSLSFSHSSKTYLHEKREKFEIDESTKEKRGKISLNYDALKRRQKIFPV